MHMKKKTESKLRKTGMKSRSNVDSIIIVQENEDQEDRLTPAIRENLSKGGMAHHPPLPLLEGSPPRRLFFIELIHSNVILYPYYLGFGDLDLGT